MSNVKKEVKKISGGKSLKLRKATFFPPFLVFSLFVIISIVNKDGFLSIINGINNWIIANVGWIFSMLAVATLIVAVIAAFSKFGNVRIGGKDAVPEISTFSWFSIALTTTMAAGVLFWGPAEPIAHLSAPPTSLTGVEPMTGEAVKFAMETMYLHWTFIPYAILFLQSYLDSCTIMEKNLFQSVRSCHLYWVNMQTDLE